MRRSLVMSAGLRCDWSVEAVKGVRTEMKRATYARFDDKQAAANLS